MHTCPPPAAAMRTWLTGTARNGGTYGHLLLEQRSPACPALVAALRPYFESAHQDAREAFHADVAIDLHPDADGAGAHARYPTCRSVTISTSSSRATRRGSTASSPRVS